MQEFDSSRRNFLAGAAVTLSSLIVTAGFPRFGFASAPPAKRAMLDSYTPVFFTEREWRCLVAACDRLIPDDETGPGAVASLVPVYIDRQMDTEYGNGGLWYMSGPFYPDSSPDFGYQSKFTPREIYRIGLKELDAHCRSANGEIFERLTGEDQDAVLGGLEAGKISLPSVPGALFFSQLMGNVKEGFFADPMYGGNKNMAGWKMIGFPGAQGDYRDAITRHNQRLDIPPRSISGKEAR